MPPLLLKALKRRDKSCRFPSCSNSRYLDAHHIKHWIDGGETNADNIAMLCSRHHTLLHDGHYSIRAQRYGEVVFLDRHNEVIEPAVFPQFPVCLTRERIRFLTVDKQMPPAKQANAFFYMGPERKWPLFKSTFAKFGRVIMPD